MLLIVGTHQYAKVTVNLIHKGYSKFHNVTSSYSQLLFILCLLITKSPSTLYVKILYYPENNSLRNKAPDYFR